MMMSKVRQFVKLTTD